MSKSLDIYTIENKKQEESLREISKKVDIKDIKTKEFQEFLDNLLYTAMHSEESGNYPAGGIAAPQVGKNIRVFYTLDYDTEEWELFINPEIQITSFLKIGVKEACLSVPNREGFVERYKTLRIKYLDRDGKKKTKKYTDINAITIQHENDHLDGILFIDKIK
jgi:peptide deformylase